MRKKLLLAALLGGLIAGTVDIGAAALIHHTSPAAIMRVIAGGLVGKAAIKGGDPIAVATLGFFLQEMMSVLISFIYAAASTRLPILIGKWWAVGGVAFGVGVFFVMNFVVVPLSALAAKPHFTPQHFAEEMSAMVVFGLIVAFAAYRGSSLDGGLATVADEPRPLSPQTPIR